MELPVPGAGPHFALCNCSALSLLAASLPPTHSHPHSPHTQTPLLLRFLGQDLSVEWEDL